MNDEVIESHGKLEVERLASQPGRKGKCMSSENPGYHNLWRATHCSMGFFLISIAVNSVSNIQSQALEESGYAKLGFFELAMFYAMYGVGSLFATSFMHRFGP